MTQGDFTIDTEHGDRAGYTAVQVLATDVGLVLVDTGPGSTLPRVNAELKKRGYSPQDLHAVLLTHIHLDHAGATGSLAQENPKLTVYVHDLGTRHLIDPSKLLASASRIYGDRMDSLWGPFLPVPADRIHVLADGETIHHGERQFLIANTPGHASHHVAYYEHAERTAYVGDVAGIRVPSLPYALPVTPPPDFNLEVWLESIERIRGLRPLRLFRTHFGFATDVERDLDGLRDGLQAWAEMAKPAAGADIPDETHAERFHEEVVAWLGRMGFAEQARSYAAFADLRASWNGIARYWRKQGAIAPESR